MMGLVHDEKRIKDARKMVQKSVKMIESHFLKETPFINSHKITLADLQALCELTQFWIVEGEIDPLRENPKLKEWMNRCTRILGASFDKAHALLYKARREGTFNSKL